MSPSEKVKYISNWIKSYVDKMPTKAESLVIGISGGIDSSVSSTLSAMPIQSIGLSMLKIMEINRQTYNSRSRTIAGAIPMMRRFPLRLTLPR